MKKNKWQGFEYATEEEGNLELERASRMSLWFGVIFIIALVYHWCF